MEYPLEKYKRFIEDTEASFFDKPKTTVIARSPSGARATKQSPNVVARIARRGEDFSIRYAYDGFNKIYDVRESSPLFYKLKRISSRNEFTHRILTGVIEHQKEYFKTGDSADLVPLSQAQLLLDSSWASRLVSRLSIITPSGEEKPLKWFFPTQRDINKRLIKQLFDNEQKIDGRRQRTDGEVKDLLQDKFSISVSRRTICYCRKELGILPYGKRLLGDGYSALQASFSQTYPLTIESVSKYAPAKSGVYELSTKNNIRFTNHERRTTAFYIGSAKDIRKRLKGHLGQSRNGGIKKILKNYECFFRYILFKESWKEEEKRLYRLFTDTHGSAPQCNRVRP